MSTFKNNEKPILKLCDSVSEWVNKNECIEYFKKISKKYDQEISNKINDNCWEKSKFRKLLHVHERLILTDTMQTDVGNTKEFIKKYMYPQLIIYLRLTCFDVLGQPDNWCNFSDWLTSKKKNKEREAIISDIETKNKIAFSKRLFEKYQKIYGVKKSFTGFVNKIITDPAKIQLMEYIDYDVYSEENQLKIKRQGTDKEKIDYLYKIRNDFTHKVYSKPELYDLGNHTWNTPYEFYYRKEKHNIRLRQDIKNILKTTVLIGISEIIKTDK